MFKEIKERGFPPMPPGIGDNMSTETETVVKPPANPLWLPEGSVRALIAIILTIGMLTFIGMQIAIPEFIILAYGIIMTFYFETRKQAAERKERMNGSYNTSNGVIVKKTTVINEEVGNQGE